MIEIREATSKKEQKNFIEFPLKLYKGCEYFVPPLYSDEKKAFKPGFVYSDTCKCVYFNAYRDCEMVGRISGIIQTSSNEKNNEKRVRFNKFDSINDQEVANALFEALSRWAVGMGMDTLCGPLGFSDLEREGLLIDGFDQLSTFEEQYNYDYYPTLIENVGLVKEVDWFESKLFGPAGDGEELKKLSEFVMKRYNLHFGKAKNVNDFIKKYADDLFKLIDAGYENLYGTVPFTDGMKKMMISNFRLIIDLKFVAVILDENEKMVCMGVAFPSIAKAVQKSGGRLTPATIIRILKSLKNPKVIDLGLIAVDPLYAQRGISAAISNEMVRMLKEGNIEYAETNLNLETNHAILNQWKRFDSVRHKVRRCYIKKLT